jgi:hypothetical protein
MSLKDLNVWADLDETVRNWIDRDGTVINLYGDEKYYEVVMYLREGSENRTVKFNLLEDIEDPALIQKIKDSVLFYMPINSQRGRDGI